MPLTAEEIELLPELPWTSTLRILSGELVDEWLPCAHKIRGIRALEIGRGQPPAAVLEAVRGRHPTLVARTIGSVSLSPERTGDIVRLDRLETLKLWPCAVTDSDLHQLSTLENLQRLEIGWSQYTSDGFAAISRLAKLRFLHLHSNFDPTGSPGLPRLIPDWNSLKQLMHLDELRLTGGRVVPMDLLGIESLPSLQVLHVEVSHFDDVMLDALIRCPKLETLHLTCSRIVGSGLSGLREAKRLKTVTLKYDGQLAEEDLRFLVAHTPRSSRPLAIDTDLSFDALARSLTNPVNRLSLRGRDRRSGEIAPYRVTLWAAGGRSLSAERILSDADMTAIGRLKELQSLSVVRDPHTDEASAVSDGLHHLAGASVDSLRIDDGTLRPRYESKTCSSCCCEVAWEHRCADTDVYSGLPSGVLHGVMPLLPASCQILSASDAILLRGQTGTATSGWSSLTTAAMSDRCAARHVLLPAVRW